MNFASDNAAGAAPEILEAIAASSRENAPAYGADDYTARAPAKLSEVFETKAQLFSSRQERRRTHSRWPRSQPFEAVFCHEEAHIHDDECAAPEFFTGGAKLVGVAGEGGKMTPEALRATLGALSARTGEVASARRVVAVAGDRSGDDLRVDEIAELCSTRAAGIGVHMDGARFANALVSATAPPGGHDMARRDRRAILRRDQERRSCLRGCRFLRFRARDEFRLSAQAGRAHVVEGAVPWRPDGGLSRRMASG